MTNVTEIWSNLDDLLDEIGADYDDIDELLEEMTANHPDVDELLRRIDAGANVSGKGAETEV